MPDSAENVSNDFKTISLILGEGRKSGTALIRVGAAVTTEELRRWLMNSGKWTLPSDVILGEVTVGGTNGSICHGGGHRHRTINDQVRRIDYVDCHANLQSVSDPVLLRAAAGAFGLLGIVTHITLELEPMSYAVMRPRKVPVSLAIPPMSLAEVPLALQTTVTESQFQEAISNFERRADQDYYSEWFWFAYQSHCWVNTWNPETDPTGAVEYTSPAETFIQWVQTWLGGVITESAFYQDLPARWQAILLASATMAALPPTVTDDAQEELEEERRKTGWEVKTALPNALHFRRDDQNMRVRDMEFEIPIPGLSRPTAEDPARMVPDWSIVRRAWWDVINICYESAESPMRLCLELRIMADSEILMAPQRGNKFGTASIEILSVPNALGDHEWRGFMQRVSDLWMSYRNETGAKLNVRPHWGKEWDSITIFSLPARTYLRTIAYGAAIPEFKAALSAIGKTQGWELAELQRRFSNEAWDEIIFHCDGDKVVQKRDELGVVAEADGEGDDVVMVEDVVAAADVSPEPHLCATPQAVVAPSDGSAMHAVHSS